MVKHAVCPQLIYIISKRIFNGPIRQPPKTPLQSPAGVFHILSLLFHIMWCFFRQQPGKSALWHGFNLLHILG